MTGPLTIPNPYCALMLKQGTPDYVIGDTNRGVYRVLYDVTTTNPNDLIRTITDAQIKDWQPGQDHLPAHIRSYIGQSTTLNRRWTQHRKGAKFGGARALSLATRHHHPP